MKQDFSICLDKNEFPDDAEFSFILYYFKDEIIKIQPFSPNNEFSCIVTEPGFYNSSIIIKTPSSICEKITPYVYIAPEIIYNQNNANFMYDMERDIASALKKNKPKCFKTEKNSQIFDFIFFPSSKQNLFVLCASAIIPGINPVPNFYRWTWAVNNMFPGNVIVVSDPTFYLDPELSAGWLVGTKEEDATLNFCEIVKAFIKVLKIPYRNIVFWGSSAGGFAAMQLCKYFPGSAAVAVNAQTDIYKFEKYGPLYRLSFKGLSDAEINRNYKNRLTTIANIDKFKRNKIFMAQNILDAHHYEEHFKPFMRAAMNDESPQLPEGIWTLETMPTICWVYSHPDGHMAETPEMARTIIKILGFK